MKTLQFSVRSDGAEVVPLRRPGALNPAWFAAFAGVLGAGTLVGALVAEGTLYSLALGLVAATLGAFGFYVYALASAARPGFVRAKAGGPLTLVRPRRVDTWQWIIPAVGLPPGLLAIVARQTPGEEFGTGQGAIWLVILWTASAVWLVKQLLDLRVPMGLRIAPAGLSGVRGAGSLNADWSEVEQASVVASNTGAKLVLQFSSSEPLVIDATVIGSDPHAVAAIIEYYRVHPDQREDLESVRDVISTISAARD